ncbi:isochorismate synthase [Vibrio metoecus]|uniref:isochorismate synthase n=1 Tax=Vibrio TaxID=662 RepID=UPI0006D7D319|nr:MULTISPECIES: isochorismate synthase MenF [Vibrio]KQB02707.1 isochorismate synthase [Vibrio metoecus]PAR57658.1 isochorismate synthase [Vibrio metoecus]PAR67330.1 isochorismate synthase [Vibrio metoecus]RBM27124.1 isochorismate synthase [Vibrio tarriae]
MLHFFQAVAQLMEQIRGAKDHDVRFTQPLAEKPPFALIDWLDAQPIFPKFYWQSRDTREEVVALGQIYTFTDPAPAYAILGDEQRVWGGRSFDGNTEKNPRCMSSFFFLPQIELTRFDEQWSLAVNINSEPQRTLNALQKLLLEVPALRPLTAQVSDVEHTPSLLQWNALVEKVLNGITQQQFKKVVLARKTKLSLDAPISAAQLLQASYAQNHHSFHFLLALDSRHSFMGSTPERLYLRHGQNLETEALAGTIGRGANAAQDMELANWLTHDSKNLNENQLVVDDIIESLAPYADHIHSQHDAQLVRLRKVQHLKKRIDVELKSGVNGVQLLSALQPTAAVAGLPRQSALAFIAEHEPFARGWYAGSMGYFSHAQAEFCVAIRSALVVDKQVQLFAGAGIVPGSVAEHEWQELDKKLSTLLSLITDRLPLGVAS